MIFLRALLIGGTAFTSACASQGDFPSLAPRPVERAYSGEPAPPCIAEEGMAPIPVPVPASSPPENDPALGNRLSVLLGAAREGQRDFDAALPGAEEKVARSGPEGSDNWIEAQQAVSRLEAARTKTVDALTDLDALALARSREPTSAADLESLSRTAEDIRKVADAQSAALRRLQSALSRP